MTALLWIVVAALVVALAPASVLTARKVDSLAHARNYRRTLANIELLEIQLGFREPPRAFGLSDADALRVMWNQSASQGQTRYAEPESIQTAKWLAAAGQRGLSAWRLLNPPITTERSRRGESVERGQRPPFDGDGIPYRPLYDEDGNLT